MEYRDIRLTSWDKVRIALCMIVIGVFVIIYPYYTENGYYELSTAKFHMLKRMGQFGILTYGVVSLVWYIQKWSKEKKIEMSLSPLDIAVILYGVITLLSYLCSPYKQIALWGETGWYLGVLTIGIFIVLYSCSRFAMLHLENGIVYWMAAALVGTSGVFLLGFLNRFLIDPLQMSTNDPVFISTIGNINWFCGFLSVFLPLGMGFYFIAEELASRVVFAIYCYIAFLISFTQGASSIFIVIGVAFLTLLWICFDEREKFHRWYELLVIAVWTFPLIRLFGIFIPLGRLYQSDFLYILCTSRVPSCTALAVSVWFILSKFIVSNFHIEVKKIEKIRIVLFVGMACIAVVLFFLFLLNSIVPKGIWPVREISAFYFSDSWGNARGGIWRNSMLAIGHMKPWQWLVGIGPDCYGTFLYSIPELEARLVSQFGMEQLACAHNELLTLFINQGLLGLVSYIAVLVVFFKQNFSNMKYEPVIMVLGLAVLCYLMHNMVSFSQILSTPYVFMLLGLSEGLLKKMDFGKI